MIGMTEAPREPALKVFISYSRADLTFADELVAGLAYDGRYEVTIDRHSIIEGEDWKARLGALIADADTVVFILSPASARSAICEWEVEEAHRLATRLLPVLAAPIGTTPAPKQLAALNYVRFDPLEDGRPRSFMAGLNALVRALNTDVAWLREHTRYLSLARSWEEAGRMPNRLLSGTDIAAAKAWAAQRPKDAPEPTELHLAFIRASEEADAARASVERQRLAEIEAAQQARAEALTQVERATAAKLEASRRLVRRTVTFVMVGMLLVALLVGVWAFRVREQERSVEQLRAETERADRFIKLVDANPAGRHVMEKICLEAIQVTTTLATTSDLNEFARARDRFWELYYGPMYIIEIHQTKKAGRSAIEASMVLFGERLNEIESASDPLPHKSACLHAKQVRDECVAYLKMPAVEPCG
jgi:hypothetical protein